MKDDSNESTIGYLRRRMKKVKDVKLLNWNGDQS